ncbi:MAG: D-alanine--D-alanine ligase, partial [Elusimicrobia bacterium]|nr:D-alanine--D-alanine ligase [Elusimicrobiota bacterium]
RKWQIYDYHLKNEASDKVDVRVPADLPAAVREALVTYARTAVTALGLRDFGRVDFRVTPDNRISFIEVNALPSLEPGAGIYAAAGLMGLDSVEEVLEAIVASAERRFAIVPRAKARRGARKLRVGFAYNEKRIKPGEDPATDTEVEYDAPKTLDAIREAIASYGHEVVDLEATPEFPALVAVADVDVVFNIAEGIRGRSREASIPAILELMDIPYTGSDAATMALTLDKGVAKRIVRDATVRTPGWFLL